nr:MAG TPA: hypothetical protein [Caudoviricetes sp.]
MSRVGNFISRNGERPIKVDTILDDDIVYLWHGDAAHITAQTQTRTKV